MKVLRGDENEILFRRLKYYGKHLSHSSSAEFCPASARSGPATYRTFAGLFRRTCRHISNAVLNCIKYGSATAQASSETF